MTATFDPTLSDDISQVRQRIGDVVVAEAQIPDETITAYLGQGLSVLAAARRLCLDLAALWSRKAAMVTLDDQRTDLSKVSTHYLELAKQIENELRPVATTAAAADPGLYMTTDDGLMFRDRGLDGC